MVKPNPERNKAALHLSGQRQDSVYANLNTLFTCITQLRAWPYLWPGPSNDALAVSALLLLCKEAGWFVPSSESDKCEPLQ